MFQDCCKGSFQTTKSKGFSWFFQTSPGPSSASTLQGEASFQGSVILENRHAAHRTPSVGTQVYRKILCGTFGKSHIPLLLPREMVVLRAVHMLVMCMLPVCTLFCSFKTCSRSGPIGPLQSRTWKQPIPLTAPSRTHIHAKQQMICNAFRRSYIPLL